MLFTILLIVQVLVSIALIGLILIQHGKGADAGAAFGSGASGTVFGAQGAANFLSRATAGLATVFFAVSLALAYLVGDHVGGSTESVTEQLEAPGSTLLDEQKQGSKQAPSKNAGAQSAPTTAPADRIPGSSQDTPSSEQIPSSESLPE